MKKPARTCARPGWLLAERRAGELLAGMEGLGQHGGDRKSKSHDATLKLDDLDITKTQSSRWQTEASVPEKKFETFLAETRPDGEIRGSVRLTNGRSAGRTGQNTLGFTGAYSRAEARNRNYGNGFRNYTGSTAGLSS